MNENTADILKYSQFWNKNLQEIEDIKQSLKKSINKLEKKQTGFDELFDEILIKINTLSSIYSSFNSIKGGEYVLKLKALMSEYEKKYIHEGIDFNLVSFILEKISTLTEESLENLPFLNHDNGTAEDIVRITINPKKEIKHKWLTFEKNGFWFILKYDKIKIIKRTGDITEKDLGSGSLEISLGNETYICRNLFPKLSAQEGHNNFYIIPDSGRKNFSATRTGRRIYAANDFIASKIKSYNMNLNSRISPGRVKLFGRNHIVLN